MLHMEQIGVRELRLNASRVLKRVAGGESVEVTSRGRPVARIVPIRSDGGWARLVAEGRIIAAAEDGDVLDLLDELPRIEPRPGVPLPSEILAEMREHER